MSHFTTFVGLDVHKNTISVALAHPGAGEAEFLKQLPNDYGRLLRTLRQLGDPGDVQVCYEAGPTGYGLVRRLRAEGYSCEVVAPAKTPKVPSNRIKTDPRDAKKLAHFLRSGDLTFIRVPTPEEEALRDLVRAREDIKRRETNTKRQLSSMMLRHGRIYSGGKSYWTKSHLDWIGQQEFDFEASREAKALYVGEVLRYRDAIADLDRRIEEVAVGLERSDLVHALRAFKGIKTHTAAAIVADIGDLRRFPSARKFMSFLGTTSSEQSSGDTHRRGPITKAGNRRVRRLLVEAAWAYQYMPHVSRELMARSQGVSKEVRSISWRAQVRLHRRLRQLMLKGKAQKKALVAVARELAGFIWAVGQLDNLLTTNP